MNSARLTPKKSKQFDQLIPTTIQALFEKNSSSTGGRIYRGDCLEFWSQLTYGSPANSSSYLSTLVSQFNIIDIPSPISPPQTTATLNNPNVAPINQLERQIHSVPLVSVAQTIAFFLSQDGLQLNSDELLQHADTLRQYCLKHENSANLTYLKNVLRLLGIRAHLEQSDEGLASLVGFASYLIPKDVRFVEWLRSNVVVDERDVQPTEHVFIYNYLCQVLAVRCSEVQETLLKALLDKSQSLPQQARMSLPVAEQTFLAIFHMCRTFLSAGAVPKMQFLDLSIRTLRMFTLWHQPYGSIASNIITLLKYELIHPGHNARRAILEENTLVDYNLSTTGGVSSPSAPVGGGGGPSSVLSALNPSSLMSSAISPAGGGSSSSSSREQYKYVKPIFYLYDTLDTASLPLVSLLELVHLKSSLLIRPPYQAGLTVAQSPPAAVMIQLIAHSLYHRITTKLQPEELEQMCCLNQTQLAPFLARLQDIENHHAQQNGAYSPDALYSELTQLKRDILAQARENRNQPQLFSPPRPDVVSQPPLEHIRVPIELKTKSNEHDYSNKQPGYPAAIVYEKLKTILDAYTIPSAQVAQLNNVYPALPVPPLPPTSHIPGSNLHSPAPPAVQPAPWLANFEPRVVRFIVVGNDRLLQHVAIAYYLLQLNEPELFLYLKCQFFIVPCSKTDLAGYIARHDLWYFRHIYTPFRSQVPLLVPWIRDDEAEVKGPTDRNSISFPSQFLRSSIQQYVREARYTLDCAIFVVEGRTDASSKEPSETIPFIQRVEIGIAPAIIDFKTKNPAVAQLKADDIQKDKNFIYQAPELGVKYSLVNCVGFPVQSDMVEDVVVAYNSIVLTNVSRRGDVGADADPVSGCLELSKQPMSKADKLKLLTSKPGTLFVESHQQVDSVTITVPPSASNFRLLIDGSVYGPYASVTISPAYLPHTGSIARFPVQTFFPIIGPQSFRK